MSYDFKSVPIANLVKIDFFAMICPRCELTHPFYVNHKGQPCFLTSFSEKAKDEFCEQNEIGIEEIVENNCFICHCGYPVRFPGVSEEEQIDDNKEKSAKLRQRALGKRVVSPKLAVVTEAQAKQIIEAGEKAMKKD